MRLIEILQRYDVLDDIMDGLANIKQANVPAIMEHLNGWYFVWNLRAVKRTGLCDYRNKIVEVAHAVRDDHDQVRQTLKHEVAHVVVRFLIPSRRVQPHGGEWQAVMRAFGVKPDRCSDNEQFREQAAKKAKYIATCKDCGTTVPYHRKPVRILRGAWHKTCKHKQFGGQFTVKQMY